MAGWIEAVETGETDETLFALVRKRRGRASGVVVVATVPQGGTVGFFYDDKPTVNSRRGGS